LIFWLDANLSFFRLWRQNLRNKKFTTGRHIWGVNWNINLSFARIHILICRIINIVSLYIFTAFRTWFIVLNTLTTIYRFLWHSMVPTSVINRFTSQTSLLCNLTWSQAILSCRINKTPLNKRERITLSFNFFCFYKINWISIITTCWKNYRILSLLLSLTNNFIK
jgi:hypothetical protein